MIGGRYALDEAIAADGSGGARWARFVAASGMTRIVLLEPVPPGLQRTRGRLEVHLEQARRASCVRHPNVLAPLDVLVHDRELMLVTEGVVGESLGGLLARLQAAGERLPPPIAARIVVDALLGLEAIHEASEGSGEPLERVAPQLNPTGIWVGADGLARVRAPAGVEEIGYTSPEVLSGELPSPRSEVYSLAVVLWEALTSQRLFAGGDEVRDKILEADIEPPGSRCRGMPKMLDAVVMRGLNLEPDARYESARAFAETLEAVGLASQRAVGDLVRDVASEVLSDQRHRMRTLCRAHPPGLAPDFLETLSGVAGLQLARTRLAGGAGDRWSVVGDELLSGASAEASEAERRPEGVISDPPEPTGRGLRKAGLDLGTAAALAKASIEAKRSAIHDEEDEDTFDGAPVEAIERPAAPASLAPPPPSERVAGLPVTSPGRSWMVAAAAVLAIAVIIALTRFL